jgi:hypothetical protein
MRADEVKEAIEELHQRVGSALTFEDFEKSIFVSIDKVPLIFFRHIPSESDDQNIPF